MVDRTNLQLNAHKHGPMVPEEEATRRALELEREARERDPFQKARHEKLQHDLEKIRERKRRRRERDPYTL